MGDKSKYSRGSNNIKSFPSKFWSSFIWKDWDEYKMLIFPSSVNVWVYEILCCSTSKLHLIREQEELILYHSILSDRPVWDIQIKFSPLWLIFCNLLHATNCFRCCSCLLVSADGGSQAGDWVGLTAHRITSLTQGAFINNFYLASMDGFNLGPSCKSYQ